MNWLKEILVRFLLGVLWLAVRLQYLPLAKLMGYQTFEPQQRSVVVSCCTNGLGHVHQMEAVLEVLEREGIEFPVILLAKQKKLPSYKLAALRERFANARFIDLDWEVDYDNGKSFKNSAIVWNAFKEATTRSTQLTRKLVHVLQEYKPEACLSFWEPSFASMLNILNCPTKLVTICSQGQIYRDPDGRQQSQGLLMRGLHQLCVGNKGTLVPLSVLPMAGAIPQIVQVPPRQPTEDFFVAYTTAPQVLSPMKKKLAGHRVLLFVKERRLTYYTRKYKRYPHVQVMAASPLFSDYLSRSRGLIASPSRGVVTQALALGKPIYLFCPRGHLEQEYNLRFYLRNFKGVACPRTRRYRRFLHVSKKKELQSPEWAGQMLTLQEWEASLDQLDLNDQAARLLEWLGQTEDRMRGVLLPLLQGGEGGVEDETLPEAPASLEGVAVGEARPEDAEGAAFADVSDAGTAEAAAAQGTEGETDDDENDEDDDEDDEDDDDDDEEEEEDEGEDEGDDEQTSISSDSIDAQKHTAAETESSASSAAVSDRAASIKGDAIQPDKVPEDEQKKGTAEVV